MSAGDLTAALLTPAEADGWAEPWRRLAERAVEPNVFYGPEVALAAMRHLPGGGRVRILAAWRGRDGERELVGLLPVARGRLRHANPGALRRGPAFFATLSPPLLAPERPDEILAALLRAAGRAGIAAIALPFLPAEGPVADALRRIGGPAGFACETMETHRRARLDPGPDGAAYLRALFKAPARNKHERQRRMLAEIGAVRVEIATGGEDLRRSLDAFLALEAAGWKGKAGTALAAEPGGAAFVRAAAGAPRTAGRCRVLTLKAVDRSVASLLVLVAQSRAYLLKIAYDESVARASPGLLLMLEATRHLLDDPAIDDADSLATARHPLADRIWTGRMAVANVVVATAPGAPSRRFRLAVTVERLREAAVARLKAFRDRRSEARAPAA